MFKYFMVCLLIAVVVAGALGCGGETEPALYTKDFTDQAGRTVHGQDCSKSTPVRCSVSCREESRSAATTSTRTDGWQKSPGPVRTWNRNSPRQPRRYASRMSAKAPFLRVRARPAVSGTCRASTPPQPCSNGSISEPPCSGWVPAQCGVPTPATRSYPQGDRQPNGSISAT